MTHKIAIYEYYGLLKLELNKVAEYVINEKALPESLTQVETSYICVSTIKGIEIFDIIEGESIR